MREPPEISLESLRFSIQAEYNLSLISVEFLPLGLDFRSGVFRAVSEQESVYLIKVTTRPLYEPGLQVPRHLYEQGIQGIAAPLPAKNGASWVQVEGWIVIVYPFIDGESRFTGMTDEQWEKAGAIFNRIHQVQLPPKVVESIRKETFNPAEYGQWVHAFESQHTNSMVGSALERRLRATWMAHQSTIHTVVTSLEKLATALQPQLSTYVICHADLHPANLLRNHAEVFVIDWDEVMLAPRERDFIFVAQLEGDSFYKGYGDVEIDWSVLTYYLLERVVQDLIECARDVCFRDDLGEETKANALQLFQQILEGEGGTLDAALAAAKRLPTDLSFQMDRGK